MLKRHLDRSETQPGALTSEPKDLSALQAQKAKQIRNELKALEKELARLLGTAASTSAQGQNKPSAAGQE